MHVGIAKVLVSGIIISFASWLSIKKTCARWIHNRFAADEHYFNYIFVF